MKELANANGFKYIKDINSFYGEINGYYFYSEPTKYVGLIRVFFSVKEPELDDLREICSKYRAVGNDGVRYEEGQVILEIKTNGLNDQKEVGEILNRVSHKLPQQEADGKTDDLGLYRDGTRLVIKNNAVFSATSKESSSLYKRQSDKSSLVGYLMAFVYMIPGSILYAIAMNIGIIPSVISFTVIYLALKGYKKYSGDPSKNELFVLLGISFVGIMIGYYIYIASIVTNLSFGAIIPVIMSIPIGQVIKSSLWSFVIAMAFNYNSISAIFGNARTGVTVSRKVKRLL